MTNVRVRAVALVVAGVLLGACSGGKGSSPAASTPTVAPADKARFCTAASTLNDDLGAITSPAQILPVFTKSKAAIDALLALAPADVLTQVRTLVAAADQAIANKDASKLSGPQISAAADRVNTYCGIGTTTTTAAAGVS